MNITPTKEERFLRILVVADDRSVVRDFADVLKFLKHNELHLAYTVADAQRTLEEVMIDIAFIAPRLSPDIQKRNGFTLLQEIHDRYQTVLIAVGKSSQPDDIREALALGAEDYVLEAEVEQRVPLILQELSRKLDTQRVIELLCGRAWTGNILELRNAIERLTMRIDAETIERYFPSNASGDSDHELSHLLRELARKLIDLPLQDKIDAITEALVLEALEQAEGNNTQAGRMLGRHRKFVERFLKKRASAGGNKPMQ